MVPSLEAVSHQVVPNPCVPALVPESQDGCLEAGGWPESKKRGRWHPRGLSKD